MLEDTRLREHPITPLPEAPLRTYIFILGEVVILVMRQASETSWLAVSVEGAEFASDVDGARCGAGFGVARG